MEFFLGWWFLCFWKREQKNFLGDFFCFVLLCVANYHLYYAVQFSQNVHTKILLIREGKVFTLCVFRPLCDLWTDSKSNKNTPRLLERFWWSFTLFRERKSFWLTPTTVVLTLKWRDTFVFKTQIHQNILKKEVSSLQLKMKQKRFVSKSRQCENTHKKCYYWQ